MATQTHADEETPLLQQNGLNRKRTPLPWLQFSIVMFLQLAEPLTAQVIYPFAPQLIRDIGITHGQESHVGHYVGLIESIFFLTQAFTVLHWSGISDRIGRKPVILTGLFGLSVSMYCFGLSQTFRDLLLSRSLNGALNGNVGVIKSLMAEMTDSTNISQAYAFMPIAWSTGNALGAMIGGSLSQPAKRFPHLFGRNEFLKKYPYFLPCAVPATFSALAWVVTFLFLKETVTSPISLAELLNIKNRKAKLAPQVVVGSSFNTTPSAAGADVQTMHDGNDLREHEKPLPFRSLLTPRVIIAAANYASLSLVDIAYRAVRPLFFATPIELGGLGLSPPAIGRILSIHGVMNGIFQVCFFARLHDRWGSKRVFTCGIATLLPVILSFPVINFLARNQGYSNAVWIVVGFQTVASMCLTVSYGAVFIFIAAASPNKASLGATNGLSQVTVSIMRAIGPAAANSLFSISIDKGYLGGYLVYYVLIAAVCGSLVIASQLPRHIWTN